MVYSYKAGTPYCFEFKAATGYVTLELDQVYGIRNYNDFSLNAEIRIGDDVKPPVTVAEDDWKGVGAGADQAVLPELQASQSAQPSATAAMPLVSLRGEARRRRSPCLLRGSGGTAVDRHDRRLLRRRRQAGNRWRATARDHGTTAAKAATVTSLVPHADRDVVLAKLNTWISGIDPVAVSTTCADRW